MKKFTEASPVQIKTWKNQHGDDKVFRLRVNPFREEFYPPIELTDDEKLLSKEEQEEIKEQNKRIYDDLVKEAKDKEAVFYVRKPKIQDILTASEFSDSIIKQGEFLMTSCWLDGDQRIQLDDEYRFAATRLMHSLFEVYSGSVEKL